MFGTLVAISLSLALAGCRNSPPPRIGPTVSLSATQTPIGGPWTADARPYLRTRAGRDVGRLVSRQRDGFLADARARRLDVRSLEKAFVTAQTVRSGTAAMTVAVRPANFGGRRGWLLVQVWGYTGQAMDKIRVWLVSADGQVINTVSLSP